MTTKIIVGGLVVKDGFDKRGRHAITWQTSPLKPKDI